MRPLKSLPCRPSILVLIVCLTMLGLQGWIEWTAGATEVAEAKVVLVNLARSLAQDVDDTIEIADTAVAAVVTTLEANGNSPDAVARIGQQLATQAAGWTRFRAVIIMGPDGNWLASSLPLKAPSGFDRAYFQHHRNDPSRKPFIGPPIKNRIDGTWSITVSRRIESADGGFGGGVLALVDLSYFNDHFAEFDLGRDSSITLFATDGTLLARFPSNEQNIGRNFSKGAVFSRLSGPASGSLVSTALTDGIRRFIGYRLSSRYPLVVVAGLSEHEALHGWRAQMRLHMLIALALVSTIGLLGLYLVRQMLRSQAAEQRVRESEAGYRLRAETLQEINDRVLLATDSGGIGLWEWDVTANKIIWDRWMYRLHGMQSVEAEPTYETWARHLHPDDRVAADKAVRDAFESGKTYTNEFRLVWADGSVHHIRSAGQITRDAAGAAVRMIGANWDVTEQRVAAEQRAIIIEAAPNGVMIVDEDGIITLANSQAEALFDYPRGTLVGQPVEILVPDAFRAAHGVLRAAFSSALSDRGMATGRDFIGRKRDGTLVTIEIMLSPVKTPRGRITVAALIDITERRRQALEQLETEKRARLAVEETNDTLSRLSLHLANARDRAEQASRAKSRFLAGMSHELRTPLNGILGYAQLLHMDGDLNETQAARVDAMLQAGKHLLEMITCVLDLSEIEADHVTLQAVEFELRPVAEACLDLIRPAAEAKKLVLSLVVAPETPRQMIADPMRLRQVLLNLLGNAAKFTSQGAIALRLRPVAGGTILCIEVTDTGPGIPAEQRMRLFQDFERLDTEATRMAEGAGLGLALSARLAGLMAGRLGHEDNPGGGSVFWLELPLDSAATPLPAAVPRFERRESQPSPPAGRKLYVLVADDMPMNRNIASSFLHAAGHTAACVEDGAEAVEAVASTDFDIVLMDVRMPRMDGLEATRRIRMLTGARGQVPIVAVTAQAFTDQVEACRTAGMDSHLGKPFDMDTLLSAVAHGVARRQAPDRSENPSTAAAPASSTNQQLPVLDLVAFERTASFLTSETIAAHVNTISEIAETVLRQLHEPDALRHPGGPLADAAHTLAGSAGMLGFARLAATSRAFERAVQTGAAEAPELAAELGATVEATLREIAERAGKHPAAAPGHQATGAVAVA